MLEWETFQTKGFIVLCLRNGFTLSVFLFQTSWCLHSTKWSKMGQKCVVHFIWTCFVLKSRFFPLNFPFMWDFSTFLIHLNLHTPWWCHRKRFFCLQSCFIQILHKNLLFHFNISCLHGAGHNFGTQWNDGGISVTEHWRCTAGGSAASFSYQQLLSGSFSTRGAVNAEAPGNRTSAQSKGPETLNCCLIS